MLPGVIGWVWAFWLEMGIGRNGVGCKQLQFWIFHGFGFWRGSWICDSAAWLLARTSQEDIWKEMDDISGVTGYRLEGFSHWVESLFCTSYMV